MNAKTTNTNTTSTDGRVQRTARSRQAIIDALIALVNQGNLIPTAQQVADKAKLDIRSVFRHFSEMENLFLEVDANLAPTSEELFRGDDRTGSLEDRLLHAMECHADSYIRLTPIFLCTIVQTWRWPGLEKTYANARRKLRKDLDDWLPELRELPSESREAVDTIASFEFWHRLHNLQGVGKKACVRIIYSLILQQLSQAST